MKTIYKFILICGVMLTTMILTVPNSSALVNSSLTEQTGGNDVVLERNSSYRLDCKITPQVSTSIAGIDTSCKRRKDTFENVTLTDRISSIPGMISWETSKTNVDFDDDGTWITSQYVKANTAGDDWSAGVQNYLLYYLNLKANWDAPLGGSNINYTIDATISGTGGTNEKGTFSDFNYTVVSDQTAPVTTANPPGGYYNTDRNVSILVNETPSTVYYSVGADSDYSVYSGSISISGEAGMCTQTDIWMKSVDIPYQTAQNWETAHYATYVIDKEDPSVSNFEADPEIVGMGGNVTISFTVSDCSGILSNSGRPNYVWLGGRSMSWVSGEDTGEFQYDLLIDGTEENPPLVEVRVTDAAGNWTIQTAAGVVQLDLIGPVFTINPNPDPIYLEQLLTLHGEADETMSSAKPIVTVGGAGAGYDHDDGDLKNYYYTYLMTARNWEASFSFLNPSDDWDGDELENWWESKYGLDPHSPDGINGGSGDPDGDGFTNLEEFQFYRMAGELIDPDGTETSGGQAIVLHQGWNLLSYTINTAWYKLNAPTGLMAGVVTERLASDDWGNFFNNSRFKTSVSNFISAMVKHPDGEWKYYGQFQPDWRNSLDYISPDEGLWINMAASDTLIIKGPRVKSSSTYPEIDLAAGWNLIGILPKTCFYTEGFDHDATGPSDLVNSQGYSDVATMLKAAFNLSDTDFGNVECIQIMYPPPYGVKAYDSSVPWFFWSLKFVQPGAGCWIKLKTGETINLNYKEP